MAAPGLEVEGLVDLVKQLKGPAFRDVNQALRPMARSIADELRPHVELLVRMSAAPQAGAMAKTIRTKSDRVPVIVIGKTNPKFGRSKFRGGDTKQRRGAMAHGIIYGPKGGHLQASAHGGTKDKPGKHKPGAPEENFYKIGRDDSGGAFGRSVRTGSVFDAACEEYLKAFLDILTHYGFIKDAKGVAWGGGGD